ncbi:MAG: hypothetical protein AAGA48_38945 [Myxococcota bacterium]
MTTVPLLWLFSTACVINSEQFPRPRDLSEEWQVDRTRILAVRAEPPEIRPGEVASLEALIAGPVEDDAELSLVWLACEDGGDFGCATDLSGLDFENPDPVALQESGLIGFEPLLPPRYEASVDLLDDLDPVERLEGLNVQTQLFAFPAELFAAGVPDDIDFNEVEVGFKRVVVSEAKTPNNNPQIEGFTVDGVVVPPAVAQIELTAGQQYDFSLLLDEALGIEEYVFVNSKGDVEDRIEEPYAAWFSTSGDVTEPVTLYPFLEMTWTAPAEPGPGRIFAVVRDRRGGMVWHAQDYVVR